MRRTLRKNRKYSRKQKGGTTFTTQEKDNLLKDGGFTQEHLDYLASLPEDLGSVFGSVSGTNYDFIKRWQMSVSDMYDIPPTPQNMRELANKTIEDFRFMFERRGQQQELDESEQNRLDALNISDANISELPSFGGVRHKKQSKRKKNKGKTKKSRRV